MPVSTWKLLPSEEKPSWCEAVAARRAHATFAFGAFADMAGSPPSRWSEANSPTPRCRILGMAARRAAVLCHLAPGSTGAELCVTSLLKLVCHWGPRRGGPRRSTCVHSDHHEDRAEGDLPTPLGGLCLPLPLWRLMEPPGLRSTQLHIKHGPFGRQPTDHSVLPHPITNNSNLWNSTQCDWWKARKILRGITV